MIQSISRGLFWLLGSSFLKLIVQVGTIVILSRVLDVSDFGIVAAATSVIVLTEMLYQMGVAPALVRVKELTKKHIDSAFTMSFVFGIALVILFVFVNPWIASFYRMPELVQVLNILIIVFPIKTLGHILFALLQRDHNFKYLAIFEVVSYSTYGIIAIILAYLNFGLWSLVWAVLAQSLVYTVMLFIQKPLKLKFAVHRKEATEILTFGGKLSVVQVINFFARKADYFIVGRYLGKELLGFYSRSYSLMNMPNKFAGKAINTVFFARFSSEQDNGQLTRQLILKSFHWLWFVTLPISAFCIFYAQPIVLIGLGDKWQASVQPFQILAIAMSFRLAYKIGANFLKGNNFLNELLIIQVVYLTLVLISVYYGSRYSISHVAGGVCIAIVVNFLASLGVTLSKLKLNILTFLKTLKKPVLLSGILCLVFVCLRYLAPGLSVNQEFYISSIVMLGMSAYVFIAKPSFFVAEEVRPLLNKLTSKVKSKV